MLDTITEFEDQETVAYEFMSQVMLWAFYTYDD